MVMVGGLRIAFLAGHRYDGGPASWSEAGELEEPGVTASSESDQWLAGQINLGLEMRLAARRVLRVVRYRSRVGRAPHAPRLVPTYGPEAVGQAVCDGGNDVRWVQSVPAVRVGRLNVVDVEAREV